MTITTEELQRLMDEHEKRHAVVVDALRRSGWSREDAIIEADSREWVKAPIAAYEATK